MQQIGGPMSLLKKLTHKKEEIVFYPYSQEEYELINKIDKINQDYRNLLKLKKEEKFYNDTWCKMVFKHIARVKGLILELKNYRRKDQKEIRIQLCNQLTHELEKLEDSHRLYLEFSYQRMTYKNSKYLTITDLINKEINNEFAKIYHHFKRTAMSLKDIPMKPILKQIREAFHVNQSSKNSNQTL